MSAAVTVTLLHPHTDFLPIAAVVERHARFVFRGRGAEAVEEAVAEAIATAFESFVGLKSRGRQPQTFPSQLAVYAVLHVKNERHVGGRCNTRDVFSRKRQLRRGFRIKSLSDSTLPVRETMHGDFTGRCRHGVVDECLRENSQTPVPDQVAFRVDFPAFLQTLTERDRRLALTLAEAHPAHEVARRFGVSPGRITQLRQCWQRKWLDFVGESPDVGAEANAVAI